MARRLLERIAREPPFRLLVKKVLRWLPASTRRREGWDLDERPPYLTGVLYAADEALAEGVDAISVVEFGVAGGNGLLALQRCAADVERETGVEVRVYGFDSGEGLPTLCGDHRDHPDTWQAGDFPMDVERLRRRLDARTELILGPVDETIPAFVAGTSPPLGFVSFDLDLYSSTRDALEIFLLEGRRMLRRCHVYFDDIVHRFSHRWAGELLAIEEFNRNGRVVIDRLRGLASRRVFPESQWVGQMFSAHDLEAISATHLERGVDPACRLEDR